jgi:putative ABC transport system ATP-binding protein
MVELRNISKSYINGKVELPVLKNVNFHIKKGEFVAIMGPSGSGKSTLMNILGCLDNDFQGEYHLDKVEVNKLKDKNLSRVRNVKIGFVFQSFNLLSKQTAIHNVMLPMIYAGIKRKERLERATKALESVGLGDRLHHKPNELSGGQRQRVAIARALVNNPAILLADEPTGNLDSQSEKEILEIFENLNKEGVTIIMVTHEPEIGKKCKRVINLRDGRVLSDVRKDGV